MNREELKQKLDVDKNGKVNFEDVVALSGGSNRKLFAFGTAFGIVLGFIAKAVFF